MSRKYLWGIDLGGTKIEAVVLDAENNYNILARERTETNGHLGYETVLKNVCSIIKNVSEKYEIPIANIGIGTPGSINPHTNLLRNCNSLYLNGNPFHLDLEKALGVPVKITNDANCFAISEYKMGVVKDKGLDAQVVFGVIMGTGVGAGVVVNGQIIEGKNGIGGEWGHNFLDASGGNCYCGKSGCIETILSGPSLERFYFEQTKKKKKLKEIVEDYRAQLDDVSVETMERLFYFFPKAISSIINVIDPDVIVIGGGLGNIDELYSKGLEKLPQFVFSDYLETDFLKPKFGDSSGVLGSALLWDQKQ